MIIGICGFIGSGKDTVADYLVNFHEFRRESFEAFTFGAYIRSGELDQPQE